MKPLKIEQLKPEMVVVFIDRGLNVGDCYVHSNRTSVPLDGRTGIIVRVDPDKPGKLVTVCLKEPHDKAHKCDGFAPDKHGVWCRAEDLYTPEDHAAHVKESAEAKKRHDKIEGEKKSAHAIAARFLGR